MVIATMMLYGFWMAYPIGALPAAIVGAFIALSDAFWRETTFLFAMIVGLVSGFAFSFTPSEEVGDLLRDLFFVSCFVATVLCWKATRWGRRA